MTELIQLEFDFTDDEIAILASRDTTNVVEEDGELVAVLDGFEEEAE